MNKVTGIKWIKYVNKIHQARKIKRTKYVNTMRRVAGIRCIVKQEQNEYIYRDKMDQRVKHGKIKHIKRNNKTHQVRKTELIQ